MKKRLLPSIFCYVDMDTNEVSRPSGKDNSDIETNTDSVKISLYYSKKRTVKKEWLKWLAYYVVTLDKKNWERIWDVRFHKNDSPKRREEDVMNVVFKEPVYADNNKEFRILARYSDYAISKDGRLLEIRKNKIRTYDNNSIKEHQYPSISIFDRVSNKPIVVLIHRLVALAWCENDNWLMKPIVNHKDKNKHNFHADNLEWISYSGNTQHANDKDSNYDVHYILRNIDTGEISKFSSLTLTAEFMGRSRINTVTEPIFRSKIWRGTNGRFEMKLSTNTSSWLYEKAKDLRKNNIANKYIVKHHNGKTEIYNYIDELKDKYLNYKGHLGFEDLKTRILKENSEIRSITQIEKLNKHTDGYQAMNIETKEIFTAKTNGELGKLIGLGKSTVTKAFALKDPNRVFVKFVFRPYSEEPWKIGELTNVANRPNGFNIFKNGKIIDTVKSARELAFKYNLNRHMLNTYFTNHKAYNHKDLIIYKENIA